MFVCVVLSGVVFVYCVCVCLFYGACVFCMISNVMLYGLCLNVFFVLKCVCASTCVVLCDVVWRCCLCVCACVFLLYKVFVCFVCGLL